MITASVKVQSVMITVKITGIFITADGRKLARVQALPVEGVQIAPFTSYTHGGPCNESAALVPVQRLENIGISVSLPANQTAEVGSL